MPLSSKRFVIISNKVNNYGYRVDTAGMDLTQYVKNPILLFMHSRAYSTSSIKPLGHMQSLQREDNGDITGIPFFTESTEQAKEIYAMVEDGTYRMLSAGFEIIDTSDDPKQLLPGQRYHTITKSKLREVSVVDIGGDDNALCLYHAGEIVQLDNANDTSAIIPIIKQLNNQNKMNEHLIPLLTLLGLKTDGTAEQLINAIQALQLKEQKATNELSELQNQIVTLNDTIGTLQQAAQDAEIDGVLTQAVNERKITEGQKPFYKLMGSSNLDNLKELFSTMPTMATLQEQLGDAGGDSANPLLKLSYDEAHKRDGALAEIKTKYPEHYKQIYKARYGKEPTA